MIFNSIEFFVFLAVALGVYWTIPRRFQNLLIVVLSYVFYGWWDWRFCGLLAISTVVDFTVGRRMAASDDDAARKSLLWVSMAVNLGILGFFKYFNFFVDSAVEALGGIGLEPSSPILEIVLPVGISFYTFQTMSYTIDIYRRRLEPIDDFVTFAAFVAYFPQLVAGPIERATNLLPQLAKPRRLPATPKLESGLWLIGLGLFKKVVIADVMAEQVDLIYRDPSANHPITIVLGLWAFSLQIYGDFSGYSDIARGTSRLMGIELMRNFEQPYLSLSITEFWRRWHISLSTWLRDYLYISLGGNRRGPNRTMVNLMLTMLLGGLWHGASWNFVVWGALHGGALAFERVTNLPDRIEVAGTAIKVLAWFATFNLVTVIWVFFRSRSFGTTREVFGALLGGGSAGYTLTSMTILVPVWLVLSFAIDVAQRRSGSHTPMTGVRIPAQAALITAAVVGVLAFSGAPAVPFLYFQF